MRAKIRNFHSHDVDLDSYSPVDPADDAVWMRMMVGPEGGPGEEAFDVLVCTPPWLARNLAQSSPLIGRHHLIMDRIDIGAAKAFLRDIVEEFDEPGWRELAVKIGRLGMWEFEDYEDEPQR